MSSHMEQKNMDVPTILCMAGAPPPLIEVFISEEIDLIALRMLEEHHYEELGCPIWVMYEIQLILTMGNIFTRRGMVGG